MKTSKIFSAKAKIVIVGGGSYNWCPRLLSDIIHAPELSGSEIFLLDINLPAARDVKAALERLSKDNSKHFRFVATNNQDDAFRDANFVIIAISTGGFTMMQHDIGIPDKYNIFQTVGDSVGPGGWSRLLRNVPVFEKMVQTIERLSPQAVVLNYTNPMAGLTGAIAQSCSLRHVGLCHGVISTRHYLSRIFQVDMEEISFRFGGINHFFWVLDFKVKHKDGYRELRKKLQNDTLLKFDKASRDPAGFSDNHHFVFSELFEEYGLLNYVADRHTCEYFNRYLNDAKKLERFKLVRTTIKDRERALKKSIRYTHALATGKEPLPEKSMETAVDIISAMVTGTSFVDVVNLPNRGQIDNLPRGAVVETMGVVDTMGFTPLAVGSLPAAIQQITLPHCHVQIMTLDAALKGNKKLALEALLLDPLCAHLPAKEVRKMGEELMLATRDYLPQFNLTGGRKRMR